MLILNFSHPLTPEHLAQAGTLAGEPVTRVIDVPVQIAPDRPLASQVAALAEQAGLTGEEWQTCPLLVNLPGYAPAAAALLAELHGRMGHFPAVLWLRPATGSATPRFEVAEIVNLQAIREAARHMRSGG